MLLTAMPDNAFLKREPDLLSDPLRSAVLWTDDRDQSLHANGRRVIATGCRRFGREALPLELGAYVVADLDLLSAFERLHRQPAVTDELAFKRLDDPSPEPVAVVVLDMTVSLAHSPAPLTTDPVPWLR